MDERGPIIRNCGAGVYPYVWRLSFMEGLFLLRSGVQDRLSFVVVALEGYG